MDSSEESLILHLLENARREDNFDDLLSGTTASSSSEDFESKEHPKVGNFVETIAALSDTDFKSHMKLQRATVEYLITKFEQTEFLPKLEKGGRAKIGGRKSMYIYIWYISNTVTFRQLGNLFSVTKSSAWVAVRRVTSWLISIAHEFVKWPEGAAAEEIQRKFEQKKKIPNVIGAIDCTHIQIKAPKLNKQDYFNRKQNYSLVLQAVVDPSKSFIDITCGEPGSLHDSKVLRRSDLYKRVETDYEDLFSGGSFLLGDSAYPSTSWIVTPFKDNGYLSESQRKFNYIHSSTRMVVENAFGLLKGRFRRLLKFTEQTDLRTVTNLIGSACVLHNICIIMDDLCDETMPAPDENPTENSTEESLLRDAVDRRASLYNYLLNKNIL